MYYSMRFTFFSFVAVLIWAVSLASAAMAADRDRLIAFLDVTGFDVALNAIALSAASAPMMLGLEDEAYGADWRRLSAQVFDKEDMREIALEIMQAALSDDLLNHGAAFYAGDLGRRLVAAENASHMDDTAEKEATGRNLVIAMKEDRPDRLALLTRLNRAIDPQDIGLRAVQEIQVRFLMAATASGIYEMKVDEAELRALMAQSEAELRTELERNALTDAAFTYRGFSDDDIQIYAEALEHPDMTRLYELMNAVQYEIMASRFEILAYRMADLHPSQEL